MKENLIRSEVIVACLKRRIREGRQFHPTRVLSADTGLSRKIIGTRMSIMMRDETAWHGLDISKWSDKSWRVILREKHHGSSQVREDI